MKKICYFFLCLLHLQGNPFVVGHLQYELGNQMFQAAATLSYAWDHGFDAYFPNLSECPWWDLPINRHYFFSRLNPNPPPKDLEFIYEDDGTIPIPLRENSKIHGGFQSEKYFAHHKDRILEVFAPLPEILEHLHQRYQHVLDHPCTVAVHVRTYLKDYGHLPTDDELHAFAGIPYYEKAVKLFPEDALFVVCSDRIDWCKEHLAHIAPNLIFIENSAHYYDFYLMTLCHHIITANSTFSWWAAYLNRNPDKIVVTPDHWFGRWWAYATENIVLKEWIRLSR